MGTLKLRLDPNGYVSRKTGKTAIVLEYNHKDNRKIFPTGEKCLPVDWLDEAEKLKIVGKNPEFTRINTKILDIKSKINWIILDAERDNLEPTVDYVVATWLTQQAVKEKEFKAEQSKINLTAINNPIIKKNVIDKLRESDDELERYDDDDPEDAKEFAEPMTEFYMQLRRYRKYKKKMTYNTYKMTRTTCRLIREFDKKRTLTFDTLGLQFLRNFETWLQKKGMSDNTVWGYTKVIKSFMNWALKIEKLHKNLEFLEFKLVLRGQDDEVVTATKAEIDALCKYTCSNPRYEMVRKMYILNCYIGARIDDFLNFKRQNFHEDGIRYYQSKNADAKAVFVPYYSIAKKILEEFNYEIPKIVAQNFNEILHEIFKESKIFEREVEVKEWYAGKMERKIYPLYELLSSHSCRKFFVTFHANSPNFSSSQAMALSGHSREKHFNRYKKIHESKLVDTFKLHDDTVDLI